MTRLILAFALAPLAVPVLLVPFIPMNPSPAVFVFALEVSIVISYWAFSCSGFPSTFTYAHIDGGLFGLLQ